LNKLSTPLGGNAVTDAGQADVVLAATGYRGGGTRTDRKRPRIDLQRIFSTALKKFANLYATHRPRVLTYLLRSLHGRSDWRGHSAKRRVTAAKYFIRTLCMPILHGRYLAFVYGDSRMCAYQRRDPRVLERHFHRYVHQQWGRRIRLKSIQHHYRFALARLTTALFNAIYIDGGASLGSLALKDGSELRLSLRPPISMGCEGELCVQLDDPNDRPVYRIVFSVIDDRPTIAIGCIQGPDGTSSKDIVRDLTRNMHGMRPKQLVLCLAYAFAQHFGCERILAVSNAAHPLRPVREKFQADYDGFWLEQKGRDMGDGWFMLPETLHRKSEWEVPSHHRSAFRRREAMRILAEQLLIKTLSAYTADTGVPRVKP